MADKRIRETTETPNLDTVITPDTKQEQTNQYESILQMVQELQEKNKVLEKKVAEANGDISEEIKDSKRKYGYEMNGITRRKDELFSYRYSCMTDDGKEKVVVKTETIGRPQNVRNENTGKWFNKHDIELTFHDGTKMIIDALDYINLKYSYSDFVRDEDIEVKDGKNHYTFRTTKFGNFTIPESLIN